MRGFIFIIVGLITFFLKYIWGDQFDYWDNKIYKVYRVVLAVSFIIYGLYIVIFKI